MSDKPDWRATRALLQEWTTNCIITGSPEMAAIYQAAADAIKAAYLDALLWAADAASACEECSCPEDAIRLKIAQVGSREAEP
jgi:hypothetical protein